MATRIGDRLVGAGLVKRDDVERAAMLADEQGRRIGEVLVEWGLVHERAVFRHLAAQREREFADAEALFEALDPEVARGLRRERQNELGALPLSEEGGEMRVAVLDPDADPAALAKALHRRKHPPELVIVTPTDFRRLQWAVDLSPVAGAELPEEMEAEPDLLGEDVRERTVGAGLFDAVMAEAAAQGASDIHLEPTPGGGRVRIRVDGELRDCDHFRIDGTTLRSLVTVIKVRASLDITERRRPQEGRFSVSLAGHHVDVRVQSQPALHGESVVLRLLSPDERLLSLDRLGFQPALQSVCARLLQSPSGLVLVAGPTGSGKTTTLYAGIQLLAADATRKVLTVEDPIEYAIEGIVQTQVDRAHGFGFSQAVRTFVRQDPDVILVGEIRDPETALEAMRASQTGHLVLAAIHAGDAVDAVQRLFDLGVHGNSIAAELRSILAQRLARRICPSCRVPHEPDRSVLREVFPRGVPVGFQAFRGEGCEHCRGYGFKGRLAVGEHLPSTRTLRSAIARHAPLDDLREAALAAGLCTMREEALGLVTAGAIALEELPRLLQAELLGGVDSEA